MKFKSRDGMKLYIYGSLLILLMVLTGQVLPMIVSSTLPLFLIILFVVFIIITWGLIMFGVPIYLTRGRKKRDYRTTKKRKSYDSSK